MFYNFTQHQLQQEQIDEGCFELAPELKAQLKTFLTLDASNLSEFNIQVKEKSEAILRLAKLIGAEKILLGGHPGLMAAVSQKLKEIDVLAVMSQSDRVSVDMPDGSKVSRFQHKFFYPV